MAFSSSSDDDSSSLQNELYPLSESDDEDDIHLHKLKQSLITNHSDSDSDNSDDNATQQLLEQGWGNSRENYYSQSDHSDQEDMQAEEKEALRIQKNQIDQLDEQDFMHDAFETIMNQNSHAPSTVIKDDDEEEAEKITVDISNMSAKDQLDLVKNSMPEVLKMNNSFLEIWNNVKDCNVNEEPGKALQFFKLVYLANMAFNLSLIAHEESERLKCKVGEKLNIFQDLLDIAENAKKNGSVLSQDSAIDIKENLSSYSGSQSENESSKSDTEVLSQFSYSTDEKVEEPATETKNNKDFDLDLQDLEYKPLLIEKKKKKRKPSDDITLLDEQYSDLRDEEMSAVSSESDPELINESLEHYNKVKLEKQAKKKTREEYYNDLNQPAFTRDS